MLPEPDVESGVTLVTVLKTLVPVEVKPSPAPLMTSVRAFPNMSLPTTVKFTPLLSPDDAVVIVILPPNSSVLGVPKADAAEMAILESTELVLVSFKNLTAKSSLESDSIYINLEMGCL